MNKKDEIFLNDYVQFQYLNHFVVADSLYTTIRQPEYISQNSHQILEQMNRIDANKQSNELNTCARVRKVAISRLYAEYVSTIEDFGALMSALKYRKTSSIFERYLRSSVREVGSFYQQIDEYNQEDLAHMLDLPKIHEIELVLDKQTTMDIKNHYEQFPEFIKNIAEEYRTKPKNLDVSNNVILPNNWQDNVWTILNLNIEKNNHGKDLGIMALTLNKTKHRFMVIEDLNNFLKAEPVNNNIQCSYQPCTFEWAKKLLHCISDIIQHGAEIVSLIIELQKN